MKSKRSRRNDSMYGIKYRGCKYSKAYEILDEEGNVIDFSSSAKSAREVIDKHLKEKRKQQ